MELPKFIYELEPENKFFSSRRNILSSVVVVLLLMSIPLGVVLVQRQTQLSSRAAEVSCSGIPDCDTGGLNSENKCVSGGQLWYFNGGENIDANWEVVGDCSSGGGSGDGGSRSGSQNCLNYDAGADICYCWTDDNPVSNLTCGGQAECTIGNGIAGNFSSRESVKYYATHGRDCSKPYYCESQGQITGQCGVTASARPTATPRPGVTATPRGTTRPGVTASPRATTPPNVAACDPNQVNMSYAPSSPKVGDDVIFSVSGAQGSTWIDNDYQGGVGDCVPTQLPNYKCKARTNGTFTWTHKWQNVSSTDINVKGPVCSKTMQYSIGGGGGGTCDSAITPPAESSITTTDTSVSWSPVAGAAKYGLRIDDMTANGWTGTCTNINSGDVCNDSVTGTSFNYNFQKDHRYHIWISSINSCGTWSAANSELNIMSFGAVKPAAPINVTATCTGGNLVVNWSGPGPKYEIRIAKDLPRDQIDTAWSSRDHNAAGDIIVNDYTSTSFTQNVGANGQKYTIWVHTDNGVVSDPTYFNNGQQLTCSDGTTPSQNSCDFNGDSKYDDADFSIWYQEFTRAVTNNPPKADCNNDSQVDLIDYNLWRTKKFLTTSGGNP